MRLGFAGGSSMEDWKAKFRLSARSDSSKSRCLSGVRSATPHCTLRALDGSRWFLHRVVSEFQHIASCGKPLGIIRYSALKSSCTARSKSFHHQIKNRLRAWPWRRADWKICGSQRREVYVVKLLQYLEYPVTTTTTYWRNIHAPAPLSQSDTITIKTRRSSGNSCSKN